MSICSRHLRACVLVYVPELQPHFVRTRCSASTKSVPSNVPQEALDAAKRMADEAYAARLKELQLAPHDAAELERYSEKVAAQVTPAALIDSRYLSACISPLSHASFFSFHADPQLHTHRPTANSRCLMPTLTRHPPLTTHYPPATSHHRLLRR